MLDLDRALGEFEKLDAEQAQMFELRLLLGCTSAETAELFGIWFKLIVGSTYGSFSTGMRHSRARLLPVFVSGPK